MALKEKRSIHFSRHLDTIMESTGEKQDSNTSYFDSASPQTLMAPSNMPDSENGDKTQNKESLSRTRIALFPNHGQTHPKRRNARSCSKFSEPLQKENICEERSVRSAQTDTSNPRDLRQVRVLFPDFFTSGTNAYYLQQNNWCVKHQNEIDCVNKKMKEDPLVRSWLNLFGAR